MPGEVNLYILNDSDSYIRLKDGMVVDMGRRHLTVTELEWSICAREGVKWLPSSGWDHWRGGR